MPGCGLNSRDSRATPGNDPGNPARSLAVVHQSTRLILTNLVEDDDDDECTDVMSDVSEQQQQPHQKCHRTGVTRRTRWQWMPVQRAAGGSATSDGNQDSDTASSAAVTDATGDDGPSDEEAGEEIEPGKAAASLLRKAASLNDVGWRNSTSSPAGCGMQSHSQRQIPPDQQQQQVTAAMMGRYSKSTELHQQQQRFWKTLEVRYGSESDLSITSSSRPRCTSSYFVHIRPSSVGRQPLLEEEDAVL